MALTSDAARKGVCEVSVTHSVLVARLTDSQPPALPVPALRVVCAWCPTFTPSAADKGASHGICTVCLAKMNTDLEKKDL